MYKHFFKRVIDFTIALIVLLIIWPILLVIYIWLTIANKGAGAFFFQERPGLHGKIFKVIKFKTMTDERDTEGNLLPDEVRLKKWGKIIRKTNMDELFQIWNILKGEMSFIGPRPILPEEMKVMTEAEQEERQSMRPGITGWEAVHEGESSNRREMAEKDLYYVRNWSLALDWQVFYKTFAIVLGFQRPDDSVRAPKMTDDQIVKED